MKKLRLILGDQLNYKHSWFSESPENVVYVMAEMRQETDYVKHHIQKIVGFFAAMRNFSHWLQKRGFEVIYFELDDKNNPQDLQKIIEQTISQTKATQFEYQLPDEYRLDEQLKSICKELSISTNVVDTEHFYTSREELKEFYKGKKGFVMENFYRMMRKKHQILMETDKNPEGGKWNFDQSNRKKWKGTPEIPHEKGFRKDVSQLVEIVNKVGVSHFGNIEATNFNWPLSRKDCLAILRYFCDELLPHFGDYQDAMHTEQVYLFHSRLSFAMNTKMLSPKEVIDTVLDTYYDSESNIHISQVEGFIRQILGWREYMRGMYWLKMPDFSEANYLRNHNKLPQFFWTGKTKMNCLHHAITNSLDNAYAHHIQRLMITGNFALLNQTDPKLVDDWYLGIYIDAIEWVEITNTRGMSQFADGGNIATKPYVSSGNYINKMSNYCSKCYYKHTEKLGEKACPFNALYWNFLSEKEWAFKDNRRMGMMLNLLHKMDKEQLQQLKARAQDIIENPDIY
ncbi:deoxyribodipyrimidine photolyase-related protein [Pustulibacterium marinum]|uniref:Deoxyribodipyrimidine photolyase-related protein n=1 Tax=Pustulibacterium marinum TaxID=1224947 RepID=A0A1I7FVR8_9FLAO|nr:cryptochrome/photolyase family protein [Pustulibacterium marinum]SFU40277.1 deoxyribodipyrimidine photolyase-related protein [Pustulibacterium marinum]